MSGEFISKAEISRVMRLSWPTVHKRLRSGEVPGLVSHYGIERVRRQVFEKWHEKYRSLKT